MKILLAEQSRAVSLALRRLLEGKGYEVESVFDGVQALERLQNDTFDLLIVETDLPRIDGPALMQCATTRDVKVPTIGILPSSEVTKEDLSHQNGMEALLPKPYPAEALLSLVEMLSREERTEESELSFWQRKLLTVLSEGRTVSYEELLRILPELFGTIHAFLSSTDEILARNGSGKRIISAGSGYKVAAI